MNKLMYNFKTLLFLSAITFFLVGCCGENILEPSFQTTLFFKSLDSNYVVDHLFVYEMGYSTKKNYMSDYNKVALPLNNKQITIFCFAKNGKIDFVKLNNIYTLKLTQNSGSCGDDSYINYKRTEISILSHSFNSATLIYGYDPYSDYEGILVDTLFFKP